MTFAIILQKHNAIKGTTIAFNPSYPQDKEY